MNLNKLMNEIHLNAKDKGFYDDDFNFASRLMLVVSELCEALEDYRNGKDYKEVFYEIDSNNNKKPCGIPSEIADAIIRLLDLSGYLEIDIESIILEKMNYNKTRNHKHGKVI